MLVTLLFIGLIMIASLSIYFELVRRNKHTERMQFIRVRTSDRIRKRR